MKSESLKSTLLKILILGVILVGLEGGLLFLVYNGINNFYTKLTSEFAILLTRQVENVIVDESFDLYNLDAAEKKQIRDRLQRLASKNGEIRDILVIDTTKTIVLSDNPDVEGLTYFKEEQLEYLSNTETRIVERHLESNYERLDIVWPLRKGDEIVGHIRCNLANTSIYRFYPIRNSLLILAGLLGAILILASYWAAMRFASRREVVPAEPVNPAAETIASTDIPSDEAEPEFATVFNRLNKLYEKTADLDKSFQQSEQQINTLLRVLNQGLLILDLNMNIITHNDYLLDALHIRSTANADKRIYDVIQKNPRLLELYRRAKDPLTHEVKQILHLNLLNGRKVNVEALSRPFYQDGNMCGVTIYIKNHELLNQLSVSLQRSMKYGVISQLASSIGHEIRNPLSSLAIHTEIVDSMVKRSVSDEDQLGKIRKSIGILNSEVERLHKLIDQFFNLAKTQDVNLTYENINDLMYEVLDLVQQQAFESNAVITHQFSKNLPLVKISKDQLKQVIINLILNSFDALDKGGEVELSTAFREGDVVISVKDNGHGIPEHVRDNIFDLYFTTKDTGGGIGLAISHKIVEAHEGKLYFETKTGVGTVFNIQLPTSQPI